MALTEGQRRAYNACVKNPKQITIIQGKAGTGKSYLIELLLDDLPGAIVLTPTNMAASVYKHRAKTLHSFFYGEFDNLDEGYMDVHAYRFKNNPWFCDRMQYVSTLIFDEISMVRSDYFEMMNVICQAYKRNAAPFGGLRVIIVGDMYQLPPVVEDDEIKRYLIREYGGIYYFNSHVIKDNINSIGFYELDQSKRQETDPEFVKALDTVRIGGDVCKIVEALEKINSRVVPSSQIPEKTIAIASSNAEVMRINRTKLAELTTVQTFIKPAHIEIQRKEGGYKIFDYASNVLLEDCERVEIPSAYEAELTFKIEAEVMFTSSNKKAGYINGDRGKIRYIEGDKIIIEKDNDPDLKFVEKTRDYRYKMHYDADKHILKRITPYIQKTEQYPIKLAYATTIHKSQGQSYDRIYVDLESPVFAPGQLYVAISRARTLQGLYLTKPVAVSDILVDPEITAFMRHFNSEYKDVYNPSVNINRVEISKLYEVVRAYERDVIVKNVFMNLTKVIDSLWTQGQYKYAVLELNKMSGIILSYYQLGMADQSKLRRIIDFTTNKSDEQLLKEYAEYIQRLYCEVLARCNKKMIIEDKLH